MRDSVLYASKRAFVVSEPYGEGAWSTRPLNVSSKAIYKLTLSAVSEAGALLSLRYYDHDGFYLGDAVDAIGIAAASVPPSTNAIETVTLFQPPASVATVSIVLGSDNARMDVRSLRFERITRREAREIVAARIGEWPRPVIPPALRGNVHANLPRTMARLAEGKPLSVVILGDSIANDTFNGLLGLAMAEHYPDVTLSLHLSVRGGASCRFFRHFNRTDIYVRRYNPDLVIIGGVSHHRDIDAIRDVIAQVQAGRDTEVLFMTGPSDLFIDSPPWKRLSDDERRESEPAFKEQLRLLAELPNVATFDFTPVWRDYLSHIDDPERRIMRDNIHYNFDGKLLLAAHLAALLAPR